MGRGGDGRGERGEGRAEKGELRGERGDMIVQGTACVISYNPRQIKTQLRIVIDDILPH